ncbi:MAG: DUF368 domain-containing protein [Candidatus Methanoplasma sp.]|jgi:putative membrane protein|nr:DUF368 domain-containing protein [Candidatus Methanoplasma sp.]
METGISSVRNFIVGALVGVTSMLPGISGAVIAVCFGIYERLVGDIACLRKVWKKEFFFLAAVALGILFGMFLAAFALDFLLENYRLIAIFLSAGLIAGQLPMLYRHAGALSRMTPMNIAALAIGLGIMIVIFALSLTGGIDASGTSEEELLSKGVLSYGYMIVIGLIMAISKLMPGISGATVLLAIGLMDPLTSGMTGMNLTLLLTVGAGLVIGVLVFSKAVNHALVNWRRSTYLLIFGLTAGSLLVLLYDGYSLGSWTQDCAVAALTFAVGVIISLILVKIGDRCKPCEEEKEDKACGSLDG